SLLTYVISSFPAFHLSTHASIYTFFSSFHSSAHPLDLHSFPTRRSSDLISHPTRRPSRGRSACKRRSSRWSLWGLCVRPFLQHKDRKSTRLNSSHLGISYAVFCLKKKKKKKQ